MFIVLNLFLRSGQFVGPTSRQIQRRSFCDNCSTLPHLPIFVLLDLFIFKFVTLISQILLECSYIRIELLWVLIYICSGLLYIIRILN